MAASEQTSAAAVDPVRPAPPSRTLSTIGLMALSVVYLTPFVWMVSTSFLRPRRRPSPFRRSSCRTRPSGSSMPTPSCA